MNYTYTIYIYKHIQLSKQMDQNKNDNIFELVVQATNIFTQILSTEQQTKKNIFSKKHKKV